MNALDLANSFRDHRGRPEDALDPKLGLHPLRKTIRALFDAAAQGRKPPAGEVERLNRLARAPRLTWKRNGPELEPQNAKTEAARTAIELLASGRIRKCGNPRCIRFFLVEGRRTTYCSETCANRTRVARHRARKS